MAFLSLILSVLIGILCAMAKLSPNPVLKYPVTVYTTIIRGIPDLVLMLVLYYGGQILLNDLMDVFGFEYIQINAYSAGFLTLGVIYGGYMCETFRGAILAVKHGQIEAGHAFGMTPRQVFTRLTFPLMVRFAIPGFYNNWQVLLKSTALVSIIGLEDVVRKSRVAGDNTKMAFTFLFTAAAIYLFITSVSAWGVKKLEKNGLFTTLSLVGASVLLGLFFAVPLGIMRNLKLKFANQIIWGYTYFFRGTPMLLQTYLIYYGLSQFEFVRESWLWFFLREAYACALLAFTLNTCAYTTEIIHGALNNMDKREIEAGKAFGMSPFAVYTRIIIPNSLRRSIPAYSNEVIFMIQGSSIASVITIMDLTGAGSYLYSKYYDPFRPYITVGLIYLGLTFGLLYVFKIAENKLMSHLKHSR
ncbi:hypothetical protein CHS0354_026822 [Potamilus streckersoni]|uniref:ABC transmembrane type-1 domain-containing protein n=1 Tax=Potamilus streckersoni TaxID=2493646 RepID=A0AAE0W765_9BIVA|nr:hypothetical protein CHS0354_026822 [Potamilus streckersoni]